MKKYIIKKKGMKDYIFSSSQSKEEIKKIIEKGWEIIEL